MKSKKKQRILALILSMVLMLSASISALAEGDVQTEASGTETTENQSAVQSLEQETVPETEVTTEEGGIDTQSAETSTEHVQENTEQEMTETPAEPEQGVTEETAEITDTTQSQAQSTEVQEESDAAEEIPGEEQPGETTEETATEETVVSEAAELKQEFTDENGNVTQTVTAYVPEGAFQATADQISMEVSLLNTDDTNYIKGMMEELLPENHYLDGYVLYQIDFKVNGEITQPAKAVTITMNGNDLAVEDTQKAHVFYYDAADPEVEGDKDQLIEVTQKDQLLKSLEESGESTENIEDYDYSEIAVNEGNADTITVKGWESTIYGCYVEKEAVTELTYEDDSVTVTVSADQAGIIPDGAELSVTPITKTEITDDMSKEEKAQAEEINAQYDFTEEQLQKDSEENATTMEGFLAYDICFLVDGEEIEPSGDVKVVMDFKEAAVPEGVSEDAEVTVKHLKEDETAEDGVVVENMAEKAEVQTTDTAAVEKVELTAESFSTFTITWNYDWFDSLTVNVNYVYVDADGNYQKFEEKDVPDFPTDIDNIEKDDVIVLSEYERAIPGYTYKKTTVGDYNGTEVSQIEAYRTGKYSDYTYYIGYYKKNSENRTPWLSSSRSGTKTGNIYIIYEEQKSDISITDDIINSGNLVGRISDDLQTRIEEATADGQTVEYKWYKNINNTGFNEVTEQKAGSSYNFGYDEEAGTPWLNVAIDQGALNENQKSVQYQVTVVINGEETARSDSFSIPYYDELQNGSFETPAYMTTDVNGDRTHKTMTQVSNEEYAAAGGVWQTTGRGTGDNRGKDIEILGVGEQVWVDNDNHWKGKQDGLEKFYSWRQDQNPTAADGDQFAELNCEMAGALYQDVLTIQGQPLYYGLSHRARGEDNGRQIESDTMRVVIMPTSIATTGGNNGGEIDTQQELLNYLEHHANELEELGVYSQEYKSDDQSWHDYSGQYTPTANLTRFFFVAIDTAATGDDAATIGNFLDDVYFTQDLPEPDPDEYQIQITKEISGLSDEEVDDLKEKLQFEITSENSGDDLNGTIIKANDPHFVWTSANGVYTGTYTIIGNTEYNTSYTYTISEKNEDYGTYSVTTNVTVNDGSASKDDTAQFTVEGQSRNIIHFSNSYMLNEMDVSFTKVDEKGTAIPGVQFALYESEDSENPIEGTTVKSNQEGIVTFKGLDAGTYVLKEIETPQGYVKAGPWTITVGDPAGGYTITGTGVSGDSTDGYQIVNHSFSSSVDVDKSVKVVNYDERTYEITLSAKSILDYITQESEPVDVVLVFDTSKSMDFPSNLTEFKKNVNVRQLNSSNDSGLDTDETYYCIKKAPEATVYRIEYRGGSWQYTDASASSWSNVSKFTEGRFTIYQAGDESTRLDHLKTAAQSFVTKLNEKSTENQVGLITFAADAEVKVSLDSLVNNYSELNAEFDSMDNNYTASGTNQADALNKAIDMLKDKSSANEKYVILLTDGAPNQSGYTTAESWKQIEDHADTLKDDMDVTLMTLGVGISYVDAGITAGGSDDLASGRLKGISSTDNDGNPYYFNADNAGELESYFNSLFATIVTGIGIENATVTDVIDSRFELVTESIPENGQYDPNTGTITWSGVNLPYVSGDGAGWSVSFTIKAKEDFMGGNVIPTNGEASGVSGNGGNVSFPQPAVNVKSLELQVPSVEETIYLGDLVNAIDNVEKIKEVLAEKIQSDISGDESHTFAIPEGCQLTESDITALFNGPSEEITKDYAYGTTSDVVGRFVYSLEVTKTMKPDSTDVTDSYPSTEVGEDKEVYKLIVRYVPIAIDHRETSGYVYNSLDTETYGIASSDRSSEGSYTLNVIAGSINIIKNLDPEDVSEKAQSFEFVVTPEGGTKDDEIHVSITIGANEHVGTLSEADRAKLSNVLKRSEWTVEEAPADGYSVAEVKEGEDNNTKYEVNNQKITFTMGTSENGTDTLDISDYSEGILGVAEFTNEKVTTHWQFVKVSSTGNTITLPGAGFKLEPSTSEPDGTTYYGKSNENGIIEWYENESFSGDPIANSSLIPGTYTLTESMAPSGYVKSEETWTVEIMSNGIKSITGSGGAIETVTGEDGTVSYYFKNEVLYDLPEAGGPGIFLYMIGGTLLLMAGSLMIYIHRRRGVLKR